MDNILSPLILLTEILIVFIYSPETFQTSNAFKLNHQVWEIDGHICVLLEIAMFRFLSMDILLRRYIVTLK